MPGAIPQGTPFKRIDLSKPAGRFADQFLLLKTSKSLDGSFPL
jgi:hypothetical protein